MPFFAVRRERGPAWDPERPLREQDLWEEHGAWADAQVANGFIVLGGSLGEGYERFLLAIEAESEAHVRQRLDTDPWTGADLLRVAAIEHWTILLR